MDPDPDAAPQVDCRGAAGGRGYAGPGVGWGWDWAERDRSRLPGRSATGCGGATGCGVDTGAGPLGSNGFGYSMGTVSSDSLPLPLALNAGLAPRLGVYRGGGGGGMSGCAESRLLSPTTSFPGAWRLVQLGMRCPGTLDGIAVAMGVVGATIGLLRPQQHRLIHLRRE